MSKSLTVLVTGVTGKQGGAVAKLLLQKGHKVRGLTRKLEGDAAKALQKAGVELAQGNLEDRASLDRALQGVDAVFAMSTGFEAGMEAETKQGIVVADAAQAANVWLVYTSVGSADRNTGIPHFDSKFAVEQHIKQIGVRAGILAPVYFMENAIAFGRDQLKQGVYATALPADRKLAQIALTDIAQVAVVMLENPDRFAGKRYDLVGDEVSGQQVVEILSRVVGKPFHYYQVPLEMIRKMSEDMALMYEWFDRVGYHVDTAALHAAFPEVKWTSYETWAKSQDWQAILA